MNRHEEQIVRVLANKVRVLTLAQVAATWWSENRWGRKRASASMRELQAQGWLHVQHAVSRPIQSFTAPLVAWRPGERQPELGSVASSLRARAMADAREVTVVYAASRATTLFGSGRALPVKLTQLTHDLNVAELYLHHRRGGLPDCCWISDDRLPRDWPLKQRPDALVRNDAGGVVRAVEYGGDYPASRLAELHAGLSGIRLAYEIW